MAYNFPPATRSITGLANTAGTNNNILDSTGSGNATDTTGYHTITVQITGGAGIASGQIIFEISENNTGWVSAVGREISSTSEGQINGAFNIAASTNRIFQFAVPSRYFRCRISTLFSGGTISAWATLADDVTPQMVNVRNATAASFTSLVTGAAAHDAAASGNPVQVAGVVRTAIATTLAAGDTCRLTMTTNGNLLVRSNAEPENSWQVTTGTTPITTSADQTIRTSAGANIRNYLYSMQVYNTSPSTSTVVVVKDISTVIWVGAVPAYTSAAPNSKIEVKFDPPLRGTANSTMSFACITPNANVYASFQGFSSF